MTQLDPYRTWLGIPPEEQPPHYYRLLGIGLFESDPDVISNAADRQMAHVRALQSGRHSELSQRILNELATARLCLLDARRRAEYEAALRERSGVSESPPPAPPPAIAPPPVAPPVHAAGPRVAVGRGPYGSNGRGIGRARRRAPLAPLIGVLVLIFAGLLAYALATGWPKGAAEGPKVHSTDRNGGAAGGDVSPAPPSPPARPLRNPPVGRSPKHQPPVDEPTRGPIAIPGVHDEVPEPPPASGGEQPGPVLDETAEQSDELLAPLELP